MARSARELFAIQKMAAAGMGNKKITETVFSNSTVLADRIAPRAKTTAAQTHTIHFAAQHGPPDPEKWREGTEGKFKLKKPEHGPQHKPLFYDRAANCRKHLCEMTRPFWKKKKLNALSRCTIVLNKEVNLHITMLQTTCTSGRSIECFQDFRSSSFHLF